MYVSESLTAYVYTCMYYVFKVTNLQKKYTHF